MVVDTQLYDLLEVDPMAPDDKIRRGYLKQARKWHPDKNKSDPTAEEKFKKISDAYKILSDPNMRAIYDESGLSGAKNAREQAGIDPVEQTLELARALFGFGKFDTIFGEVTTLPMFVLALQMMGRATTTGPKALDASEEMRKQMEEAAIKEAEEKEELLIEELAVFLTQKVKLATQGDEFRDAFQEMIKHEAEYLSSFPGGDELLASVGYIYVQEAKQHMNRFFGMESLWSEITEKSHCLGRKMSLISSGYRLFTISNQLQKEVEREELAKIEQNKPESLKHAGEEDGVHGLKENKNPSSTLPTYHQKTDQKEGSSVPPAYHESEQGKKTSQQQPQTKIPQYSQANSYTEKSRESSRPTSTSSPSSSSSSSSQKIKEDLKKGEINYNSESEKQKELMETILSEGLAAMWKLGKYLIEERVRKICEKMMTAPQDQKIKDSQIQAVLEIGQMWERVAKESFKANQANQIPDEAQQAYGLPKFR